MIRLLDRMLGGLSVSGEQRLRGRTVSVVLGLLVFLTYGGILSHPFMMDDYGLFLENPRRNDIRHIFSYLIPDQDLSLNGRDGISDAEYRPLSFILPLLEYRLFREDPFGYHMVSLALFYLVSLGIEAMVSRLVRDREVGFWTAVFFIVHPLNGMLANYITASVLAVGLLAQMGSVMVFLKSCRGTRCWWLQGASVLLFGVSLLCHEAAVILPVYLIGVIIWKMRLRLVEALRMVLPFLMLLVLYLIFRWHYAGLKSVLWDKIFMYENLSGMVYGATFVKLVLWYLEKFLTLDGIVLIWATPLVRQGAGGWLAMGILLTASVTYGLWRKGKGDALGAWVWFLLGLVPVMGGCIFTPSAGFIIEPHWLFFPSLGLFAGMALLLQCIRRKIHPVVGTAALAMCVLALWSASQFYNTLWGDEKAYCRYWMRAAPGYHSARFYLASSYLRDGDFSKARQWFQQAVAGQKSDWQIYANLGDMASAQEDLSAARRYYEMALVWHPRSSTVFNNWGVVSMKGGDLAEAEVFFQEALRLNGILLEPRLNLALVYERRADKERALRFYEEAERIDPDHVDVLGSLTRMYLNEGKRPQAQRTAERFLYLSGDEKALVSLGSLLASQGEGQLALRCFGKALRRNPRYLPSYQEMGKVLANAGRFPEAIAVWGNGLRIHPESAVLQHLIQEAQRLQATGG